MNRRSLTYALLALVLGAAAAGAASRLPVAQPRPYDLTAIPSAAAARWTSLGHPTLVANLWWLRSVQYMGDERADERGWDKLYPAVNLITDLDPRHGYAYQVAGIMLGGAGRISESNALLEKGTRNVPERYALFFQRAVNAFLYQGDYLEAARWFELASRAPGAPAARMRGYAAAMLVKGDDHEAAVALLNEALNTSEDDTTRESLRGQLLQVELERRAADVERAVAGYRARHGYPPAVLFQLVLEGFLPELPADPFGGSLFLDVDGRVRSTVHRYRIERSLNSTPRPGEAGAPGQPGRPTENPSP